jgi:hypothetical protein
MKKNNKVDSQSNSKVMSSVASTIDFIKEQIVTDLMMAKSSGMIDYSNEDLQKIARIVNTSIGNSFVKASSQIENTLKR